MSSSPFSMLQCSNTTTAGSSTQTGACPHQTPWWAPIHASNWVQQPVTHAPRPNGRIGGTDMPIPPHSTTTHNRNIRITRHLIVASHDAGNRSTDRFDIPARVTKEGGDGRREGEE